MTILKKASFSMFAFGIMVLSPVAAYADCDGCFRDCNSIYPDDGTEHNEQAYIQCVASCYDGNGTKCGDTTGSGG